MVDHSKIFERKENIKLKRYNQSNVFCQKCGAENSDGSTVCKKCGADLRLVLVFPEESVKNSKFNDSINAQIEMLEGQKKGHLGPIILVIIGIFFYIIGKFPGLLGLNSDSTDSAIGWILMIIAVIWDSWRIYAAAELDNKIKTLRDEIL